MEFDANELDDEPHIKYGTMLIIIYRNAIALITKIKTNSFVIRKRNLRRG